MSSTGNVTHADTHAAMLSLPNAIPKDDRLPGPHRRGPLPTLQADKADNSLPLGRHLDHRQRLHCAGWLQCHTYGLSIREALFIASTDRRNRQVDCGPSLSQLRDPRPSPPADEKTRSHDHSSPAQSAGKRAPGDSPPSHCWSHISMWITLTSDHSNS